MTVVEFILIILGIIIVAPIVVYLCMKLGTVGFYRGKEAIRRENDFSVSDNNNNNNEN